MYLEVLSYNLASHVEDNVNFISREIQMLGVDDRNLRQY